MDFSGGGTVRTERPSPHPKKLRFFDLPTRGRCIRAVLCCVISHTGGIMRAFISAAIVAVALCGAARADDLPDWLSLHGQSTFVFQYHPAFRSPYRGPDSLAPQSVGDETFDATAFIGARLWHGGAIYADPEIDQGFGLSDTLGVAGFPSGEAYKVGDVNPYFRLQRLFVRQSFDLGGDSQAIDSDANVAADTRSADNLVFTLGKFSVGDVFDTNTYAHDPRGDFLNWPVIDE